MASSSDPCTQALLGPAIHIDFEKADSDSSISVSGSQPGNHGGQRLLLKRTGQWYSNYAQMNFDNQGDPRWFIAAVGEDAAKFFGFEILDAHTMLIPDPAEFNGAIQKVNQVLKQRNQEPIGLGFVGVNDNEDKTPLSTYLNLLDQGILKFADRGHHLIHDMSFHSGAIFLPNVAVESGRKRARYITQFLRFAIKETESSPKQQLVFKMLLNHLKYFLVRSFDDGSAFGNVYFIAKNTTDPYVLGRIGNLMKVKGNANLETELLPFFMADNFIVGGDGDDDHQGLNEAPFSYLMHKYTKEAKPARPIDQILTAIVYWVLDQNSPFVDALKKRTSWGDADLQKFRKLEEELKSKYEALPGTEQDAVDLRRTILPQDGMTYPLGYTVFSKQHGPKDSLAVRYWEDQMILKYESILAAVNTLQSQP